METNIQTTNGYTDGLTINPAIIPNLKNKILFLTRSAYFRFNGASPISTYLRKHGINSRIIETATSKFMDKTYRRENIGNKWVIDEIVKEDTDIIGISLLCLDITYFCNLFDELISSYPDMNKKLFVFGGAGAITAAEFIVGAFPFIKNMVVVASAGEEIMRMIAESKDIDEIVKNSDQFPYTMIKNGETVIDNRELTDTELLQKRTALYDVYREALDGMDNQLESKGAFGESGLVTPNNIEYLPEAFNIHLELGCKARCSFCSFSNADYFKKIKLRRYEPEEFHGIVGEIVQIILDVGRENHIERLRFTGENIFENKQFLEKLCDGLLEVKDELGGIDFWSTGMPVDVSKRMDFSLLEKMKEVGFHSITLGIETYDKQLMKDMRKSCTVEMNFDAVKKLNQAGITAICTSLMFYPTATMTSILNDLTAIITLYEEDTIYIAFHPVLLAIHETKMSIDFKDCIEYDEVSTQSGIIKIPKYVRPRDKKIKDIQIELMKRGFHIIEQLEKQIPNIVLTRTFEGLIYLKMLCDQLGETELADRYWAALQDYYKYYPKKYRKTFGKIFHKISKSPTTNLSDPTHTWIERDAYPQWKSHDGRA